MKDTARRSIAYIVGSLISGQSASAIYDFTSSKYTNFSGNISNTDISVFDYDLNCYVCGFGINGSFSLYHYGNGNHISMEMDASSFQGYDYDSGAHFSGSVTGNTITIYDYGTAKNYTYQL